MIFITKVKRFAACAVSVLLLISLTVTAFAASTAEIYSDSVKATTDKAVLIPVRIKNNPGIMGFKITAEYDKSVLTSPKVTAGNITKNGIMNDSIGVSSEGRIDVVWSGTQNETADGTLFVISFKAVKAEDTVIKLSYSQPDTFNEAWEDVELKCSDTAVVFSAEEPEKETVTSINQLSSPPNGEEIKNAVDVVLGETDKGYLDEIPEEEKADFVDRTNEILGQFTGKTEKLFESFDEIKESYNNAVADKYVDDTLSAVDSDKIDSAIKDSLASVGAESIDKIPAEKKDEFIQKVENNLSQYAPDVDTISGKLTADDALEAIEQLQGKNEESATQGKKVPEPQKKSNTVTVITVTAAVIAAAMLISVAVVYMKRKKNKEDK